MMPTNISAVQSKVIGICCLEGSQKETVKKLWQVRFPAHHAFFVECTPGCEISDVLNSLLKEISAQGIMDMSGERCIFAYYLDLTKELDLEWAAKLWKLPSTIDKTLNCTSQILFQFGYVGRIGCIKDEVQRENVRKIVDLNCSGTHFLQRRLCLVADPALSSSYVANWKAPTIFLDILRRHSAPADILPAEKDGNPNNDVGFFRYAEYNEKQEQEISEEIAKLERLLGSGGSTEFATELTRCLSEFADELTQGVTIPDPNVLVDAGMIVDAGFLGIGLCMARRGTNREFNNARERTKTNVEAVADTIRRETAKAAEKSVRRASDILQELFDKAQIGINLKRNRREMEEMFMNNPIAVPVTPMLELNYNENGYRSAIEAYLTGIRASAIAEQKKGLLLTLTEAYKGIHSESFDREETANATLLAQLRQKLASIPNAERLTQGTLFNGGILASEFNPALGRGGNQKYLLSEHRDISDIVDRCAGNAASALLLEISTRDGSVQSADESPLKALQVVFLDADDNVIKELLPVMDI